MLFTSLVLRISTVGVSLIRLGKRFAWRCKIGKITPPDRRTIDEFLNLLSSSGRLAPILRRLHELRILEQLIPEFKRIRGLLQFNAYHQYTVDAHSLRVQAATDLGEHPGGMGDVIAGWLTNAYCISHFLFMI